MTDVQELRNELADNFDKLKKGDLEVGQAAQMNSAADKIIKTVMLELKQREITGAQEDIPFLNYKKDDQLPGNNTKERRSTDHKKIPNTDYSKPIEELNLNVKLFKSPAGERVSNSWRF